MSLRPLASCIAALLVALVLMVGGMPAPAHAQVGGVLTADVPDSSRIPNLFSTQGGNFNGQTTGAARFQSSAIPVANKDAAEIVNFECIDPATKQVVPQEDVNRLGTKLREARGKTGDDLRTFLQGIANDPAYAKTRGLIKVTDKPEEIYNNIPPTGCEMNSTIDRPDISFTDIFTDFEGFISDVFVNTVTYAPNKLYELSAPHALRYAFFTPHVERGETLLDVVQKGGTADYRNSTTNQQLGFSKQSIAKPEVVEQAMWIKAALWLRWFLSGFFVLIIVGVGFVYMFNRSAEKQRAVLRILPRLLLATALMLVIGPLMGWAISSSNLVTKALFDVPLSNSLVCQSNGLGTTAGASQDVKGGGCGLMTQLNSKIETLIDEDAAEAAGTSGGQSAGGVLIGTLTLLAAALFFMMLLLVAVGRQVLLLLLVAVSPAACFALVFEKTRQWATRWMQAFAVVCIAPAAMALTLYFGLQLANLAATVPIIWFALMLITFLAVWKIPLMLKGWLGTGQRGPSGSTTALRMASAGVSMIPGGGLAAGTVRGLGGSLVGGMHRASDAGDQAARGNFRGSMDALRPGLPSGRRSRGLTAGGGGGGGFGRGGGGGIGPAYGGGVRNQTEVEKDEERRHARVLAEAVGESVAEAMRRGDATPGQVNISNPDEVRIAGATGIVGGAGRDARRETYANNGPTAAGAAVGGDPHRQRVVSSNLNERTQRQNAILAAGAAGRRSPASADAEGAFGKGHTPPPADPATASSGPARARREAAQAQRSEIPAPTGPVNITPDGPGATAAGGQPAGTTAPGASAKPPPTRLEDRPSSTTGKLT